MGIRLQGKLLAGSLLGIGIFLFGIALSFAAQTPASSEKAISIIYPEVAEPFSAVFNEILSGIESHLKRPPPQFKLLKSMKSESAHQWLSEQNSRVVIALGSTSFEAVRTFTPVTAGTSLPMLIGAVLTPPAGVDQVKPQPITISYAPSPELLFYWLKRLSPQTTRVHVVYHKKINQWLIDEAKHAALAMGLELEAYEAEDFKDGGEKYYLILGKMRSGQDALWILQDVKAFSEQNILPNILEKALSNKLVVFSGSLAHVSRGALFGLYPDNKQLGVRLGEISQQILNQTYHGASLQSLRDIKVALHTVAADKLNLKYKEIPRKDFELTFPDKWATW